MLTLAGLRRKRGGALIDVIFTLFIMGIIGTIFSAVLPTAITSTKQAQQYKVATAIAQRKMEQLRAMNYESLTQPNLAAAQVIDPDSYTSPYSFTSIDNLPTQLPSGKGTVTVTDVAGDARQVEVTISWEGPQGTSSRSITLTGLFADRRVRKVN